MVINSTPTAITEAYRHTGAAAVTILRDGRPVHEVALRRYHTLREWRLAGGHPWRYSGGFMRASMTAYVWPAKEVHHP